MGGTFDPIHYGHLAAAEEARAVAGLDEVVFLVAGVPPHKPDEPMAPAEDRLNMVERAIASNSSFVASRIELDRTGPSFTSDSLEALAADLGSETDLYLIMGMDSLAEIGTWHRPDRLIELARLVVVRRPGYEADLKALDREVPGIAAQTDIIDMPEVEVSSTDLQDRIRNGMPIKYQVPPEVEAYIYEKGLYL
ncbi:MAG: nicotinate-nucleotide adenylyltransferase [Anaerolineae bacterium]